MLPNTLFLPHRYDGVWETHKHLKMVELQQQRGGPSREGYMSVKLRQQPMNEWLIRQQTARETTASETAQAKFNLGLILLREVRGCKWKGRPHKMLYLVFSLVKNRMIFSKWFFFGRRCSFLLTNTVKFGSLFINCNMQPHFLINMNGHGIKSVLCYTGYGLCFENKYIKNVIKTNFENGQTLSTT